MSDGPDIIDQAIAWHVRQAGMADADWLAFVAWLEADPAHARAYDSVAMQDALIAQTRFDVPQAANDDDVVPGGSWFGRGLRWAGGTAVAAALAAWLLPLGVMSRHADQVYATRDGERRDVRLSDGTQMAMNGGTTIRIDGLDGRSATLDRGEVVLHVVHDAARPFTLRAGDRVIRDVGTTFNVLRSGERLAVAVREGSVLFQPGKDSLQLTAGQALTVAGHDQPMVRSTVAPESVGGWRTGQLSFDGAPLADVAASLRRLNGVRIAFVGDLSKRPFTGMIHVTGAADRDVPHLADLIGATWRRDGEAWVLAERAITAP